MQKAHATTLKGRACSDCRPVEKFPGGPVYWELCEQCAASDKERARRKKAEEWDFMVAHVFLGIG